MRARGAITAALAGLWMGCIQAGSVFTCADDGECQSQRAAGRCELSGYCSFPDEICDSGRRYDENAGDGRGGECVPPEESADSGGTATGSSGTTAGETSGDTGTPPMVPDPFCGDGNLDPGEVCDDGNQAPGDGCSAACLDENCGNTNLDPGELCDDGNTTDNDGCDADCQPTAIADIVAGDHTCVLMRRGQVRCWGNAMWGSLGYGSTDAIGDDELPADAGGDLDIPQTVLSLSAGALHTCAHVVGEDVRCWGAGFWGQMGLGSVDNVGDDELPSAVPQVNVGGDALMVRTGNWHNCVPLAAGAMRCWGFGAAGQLGAGNTENVGDDEQPGNLAVVPLGVDVVDVEGGGFHTCAITMAGTLRCWGAGGSGQLGYGSTMGIGASEPASAAGDVSLPSAVTQLALGDAHTCALLDTGDLYCWGRNNFGQLGLGMMEDVGDDELADAFGPVPVPGNIVQIAAGIAHTCALVDAGDVICWGANSTGQLGYGNTDNLGDDEAVSDLAPIELGATAVRLATRINHTCALTDTGAVRCWGGNGGGQLGYGHTDHIGDDETPATAGDVVVFRTP